MLKSEFKNKETWTAFVWLNNNDEFYKRICNEIDVEPYSPTRVKEELEKIIEEAINSVNSGLGSEASHSMIEAIGYTNQIDYNELLKAFTEDN